MRVEIILVVIAVTLCSSSLKAQSYGFEWANITSLKSLSPGSRHFLADNSGNLLLTGTFSDTMDIDPGPGTILTHPGFSNGNSNIFIQKQNSQGALLWFYTLGDIGSENVLGIAVDSQSNIYVAGRFDGTVDFDAGPGVSQLTAVSIQANFILKLSPQGQFLWVRKIGENAALSGIAHDRKGGIYTCGVYKNTEDFNPGTAVSNLTSPTGYSFFIQKLDTAGNFRWAKSLNNNASVSLGQTLTGDKLVVDTAGNPCLAGFFIGTVDFDPGPAVFNQFAGTTTSDYLMFVVKLDTLGNFGWMKRYGKATPSSCATDKNNNIILTGSYDLGTDFDPGPAVVSLPVAGGNDAFVLKITAAGDFSWVAPLASSNNDQIRSVKADAAGNVYLVGYSETNFSNPPNMDFDPGSAVHSLPYIPSPGVSYLYRLTPQGGFKSLLYLPSGYSLYNTLAFTDTSNLYLLAVVADSLDCNHGTGVYKVYKRWFTGGAPYGYSVIKLRSCTGAGSASTVYDSACGSRLSPSGRFTWTASGTYRDTLANANGCDSVLTFYMTVYPKTHDTVQAQSCGPYLSPGGTHTWYTGGIYHDTLTSSHGCDSIITVYLTMNGSSFNTISEYVCRSYVSPSGRYTWTASGNYYDTLANVHGCDSIITINLTVHDTSVSPVPNGLGANSNVGTFQWLDCGNNYAVVPGATSDFLYPGHSGRYAVVVSYKGCVDTSGCHEFWALGINGTGTNAVKMLTDRANGIVTLLLPEPEQSVSANLISSDGRVVWSNHFDLVRTFSISLEAFSPGIYLLDLKTTAWRGVYKIIKAD